MPRPGRPTIGPNQRSSNEGPAHPHPGGHRRHRRARRCGIDRRAGTGNAPDKVTTSTIGVGRFTDIDAKVKTDINPGTPTKFWKSRIQTRKSSDLHVLQNTIAPGGTFGWHRHPGPSLVIVKSGTATFYLASDPTCAPHVVPAGSGFVDQGQDVHVVRNEGSVDLVTVVVSLVPAGFDRRIDEPSPGSCLPNG
jgi:quercetin dioxygenase-like cupin family protein